VAQHRGAIGIYLSALVLDWLLFYYVWAFTKRTGTSLRELVGGRWATPKDVAHDLAITLPFWVIWEFTAQGVDHLLGANTAKSVDILLPQTALEILVWFVVSITAGFCEEAVFRGYLQKQFRALTGNAAIAVLVQGVLFGLAHGYQGVKKVILITVLGGLYGLLALWRKSLRPGMIAHAWSDVYGGLQLHFLSRLF
jgi:membrane protease YdiL (CAAX protease family)